jgi:hypothetical protein
LAPLFTKFSQIALLLLEFVVWFQLEKKKMGCGASKKTDQVVEVQQKPSKTDAFKENDNTNKKSESPPKLNDSSHKARRPPSTEKDRKHNEARLEKAPQEKPANEPQPKNKPPESQTPPSSQTTHLSESSRSLSRLEKLPALHVPERVPYEEEAKEKRAMDFRLPLIDKK